MTRLTCAFFAAAIGMAPLGAHAVAASDHLRQREACFELFAHEPIATISDLKGKKVGIHHVLGSGDHLYMAIMAANVGLDPHNDINWIVTDNYESLRAQQASPMADIQAPITPYPVAEGSSLRLSEGESKWPQSRPYRPQKTCLGYPRSSVSPIWGLLFFPMFPYQEKKLGAWSWTIRRENRLVAVRRASLPRA